MFLAFDHEAGFTGREKVEIRKLEGGRRRYILLNTSRYRIKPFFALFFDIQSD